MRAARELLKRIVGAHGYCLGMTGRVEHGEVFTRRWVVEALLDLTGYTSERRLDQVVLVVTGSL